MYLRDRLFIFANRVSRRLYKPLYRGVWPYALPVDARETLAAQDSTALAQMFYGNTGRVVHKWTHYLPVYEKYLGQYRGTAFKMLEIGVFQGGSLDLWRRYFGPAATIFGVDINPACAGYVDPPNQVRIGSQADGDFLRRVVAEMGGLDVVLDDGSHIADHQRASFEALFPLLVEGGLYIIEDTHTSYIPGFLQGGYRRKGTAIEFAKDLIDGMHGHFHRHAHGAIARDWIPAMHIYDSMIIIEKQRRGRPGHIKVGAGAK